MVNVLTNENFDNAIKGGKIVVIDFWAEFCCQCKSFKPTFESVSEMEEFKDNVDFYTCDGEEESDLSNRFSIRGLPTVILIKNGVSYRANGVLTKDALVNKINEVINSNLQ